MKRQWGVFSVFVTSFVLTTLIADAAPLTFRAHEDARDEVIFISKAPLEKITGKAQKIRAEVRVENLEDLFKGKVSAKIEVDLATVDTGIALRNQHMRDMYLETDKYPKAVFTLTKVERAQTIKKNAQGQEVATDVKGLKPGEPTRITAAGTFELHGQKREIRLTGLTVTHVPESESTMNVRKGDLLRVEGSFGMKLGDYGIKRPQMLFLRIAEDVLIDLDITAGTGEQKAEGSKQKAEGSKQ